MQQNQLYINILIKLAKKASKKNEVPVAAIIVNQGKIIAKAYNTRNRSNKTTDHAEIKVIIKANKKLKSWRLNKCTLYVTTEPCDMCKNVIKESRIEQVFYLLPRPNNKKIYNKTTFNLVNNEETKEYKEKYQKISKNFWENKR